MINFLTNFEKHVHCGGVMILPFVLEHHILELLVIVLPAAQIEDQVGVRVLLLKERGNL